MLSPFGELRTLAEQLGLSVKFADDGDVDRAPFFYKKTIVVEYEDSEQLAHELGHFLVAPPNRRYHYDYGHQGTLKNPERKELEELAAGVLGMMLQLRAGEQPSFSLRAYLWNDKPKYYHWALRLKAEEQDRAYRLRNPMKTGFSYLGAHAGDGFWLGACKLHALGWVTNKFKINEKKLTQLFRC